MGRRWLMGAACIVLLGAAHAPRVVSHPIVIVINGETLPLQPPPRSEHGHLFVPVRRTIEALGLDFAKSGKRVTTHVGARTVTLTIGSRLAQIDDQTVYLDAPAVEINNVLYAPLRFFTDVLGSQAEFDRRTNTVSIVAQLVGRSGDGTTTDRTTITRTGTVSAVDVISDPPTITLTYNASVRTIPIGSNADIEMRDVNANVTVPGELSSVRPGDFTRITMLKNGHVERIEDEYGSNIGRIAAVANDEFVLDDGHVIAPDRTTLISVNGKAAQLPNLAVGDRVTVRYNVETNEVREVLVGRRVAPVASVPAVPVSVGIESVSSSADHPLRAGESVSVTLHGTAGGSASFDIGPYVTNLAMSERSAGTYQADYAIPPGASFSDVPIIGHLRVHGVDAPDVQAPQELSASSIPPGVSAFAPDSGAIVNTSHPAIYATFAADAIPVNPSSVTLWVNGRDVTSNCVRSARFIQYMPAYTYRAGPVHVTVRVADRAGNTTTKSWTFSIRNH